MANRSLCVAFTVGLVALVSIGIACLGCNTATDTESPLASIPLADVLTNGRPTLAEFGWKTCIPCKKMKPILEELAAEYEDQLDVVIVEVYEHRDLTQQYGITLIPTQIIFDGTGVEAARHVGFWPKEDIIAQLENMDLL